MKYFSVPLFMFISLNSYAEYPKPLCPEEQETANKIAQKIENEWPLREPFDPVSKYIKLLGERLGRLTSAGQHINWNFMVTRNLEPNAYSIGNGYVIVTEGALIMSENESEFAAIVAHELGHQLAGHFCRESGYDVFDNLKSIFNPDNSAFRVEHGSMTHIIDPIKERQADQIALHLLELGGFNPHALLNVSRHLLTNNSSHYYNSNRLKTLDHALRETRPITVESSKEFYQNKKLTIESSGFIPIIKQ